MLTLSLLRHAKSDWSSPELEDFDRTLARRGQEAAPRMGAYMAAKGLAPDLVLCSPAARARQTLDLVLPYLPDSANVEFEESFYLAAPSILLARVRKVGSAVRHILVVGHDPGLHGLAIELAGSGDARDLKSLAEKFPTAGLAVITFPLEAWSAIQVGEGRLSLFMTPRLLEAQAARRES